MTLPNFLINGSNNKKSIIVLAHSAGAPMDTSFMNFFSSGLANKGYMCVRFEFPYMSKRRQDNKKRPPDKPRILIEIWREIIFHFGENLVIGGKSMGGRIASLIADDVDAKGLIVLGYPFFNSEKIQKERIKHLENIKTPTLICQGERDKMGSKEQVEELKLSDCINCHWVEASNHSLEPLKKSGLVKEELWDKAINRMDSFIKNLK